MSFLLTHPLLPSREGIIGIYLLIFLESSLKNPKMITITPLHWRGEGVGLFLKSNHFWIFYLL